MSHRIWLNINIINIWFEYLDTDTVSNVEYSNSEMDRFELLQTVKNIYTVFIPIYNPKNIYTVFIRFPLLPFSFLSIIRKISIQFSSDFLCHVFTDMWENLTLASLCYYNTSLVTQGYLESKKTQNILFLTSHKCIQTLMRFRTKFD